MKVSTKMLQQLLKNLVMKGNLVVGANIAGFLKVADAMSAQRVLFN